MINDKSQFCKSQICNSQFAIRNSGVAFIGGLQQFPDRPTHPPTNQPTPQPTNQPTPQPTNQPTDQPANQHPSTALSRGDCRCVPFCLECGRLCDDVHLPFPGQPGRH
ncbi:MAG: PT domain-containing protein [Anaerolineae bacterium]|nr:PT domain-containing protein [Anaerolineae bacterium]